MEGWKNSKRKNVNRGYRKLVVWQDSIAYYCLICDEEWDDSFIVRESNTAYGE